MVCDGIMAVCEAAFPGIWLPSVKTNTTTMLIGNDSTLFIAFLNVSFVYGSCPENPGWKLKCACQVMYDGYYAWSDCGDIDAAVVSDSPAILPN